ncbi:MAG: GntP family permease [Planctomycetaceae bacterium]|nr:GntP family permease [Planctomycetaceae bacterium]
MSDTWVTLAVILAGVAIVVGSVLWLRLHAFLALVFGAIVVAALTPRSSIEKYFVERSAVEIDPITDDGFVYVDFRSTVSTLQRYELVRYDPEIETYRKIDDLDFSSFDKGSLKIRSRVHSSSANPPKDGDLVIHGFDMDDARKAARKTIGARIAQGFGDTCTSIGILIAMAAIIGKCLLDSGAADRIVRTALNWFGERAAPFAFLLSGFTLGIPVFFDTVFYLMIPLGKAMQLRTGRNYLLYVLTIVCGATMAHSLVPPTPGPMFVAEELGVDIGTMMIAGSLVGMFAALAGYLFAVIANRTWTLPLRESADVSLEQLQEAAELDESQLPPLWISLLPILLPVLLIAGEPILASVMELPGPIAKAINTLGNKTIALTLAAIVAMVTLVWQKRTSREELGDAIQGALASGGVIILITAAGGAFGGVLRETNVAGLINDLPRTSPAIICTMAWLITAAIRTAQGSATVAMITAVGILSGLASAGDLGFHPVYLALAIGCGSKPVAWMNDSGFWVVTRMSGMTESEGLKFITPMSVIMGVVGLAAVLVGVTVYPMN